MMCKHCGNTVKSEETFCGMCGTPIEKMEIPNTNYANQSYVGGYAQQPQNTNYVNQGYVGGYTQQPPNTNYVNQGYVGGNTQQPQNTNYVNQGYVGGYTQQPQNIAFNADEELLKSYVGENYNDFVTKKFNFPMFFLGGIYLIYRKTWLFLLIMLVINIVILTTPKLIILFFLLAIVYACLFNNLYINHAKRKVEKIKNKNPNMNFEQLKELCERKGGTNVVLAITLPILLTFIILALVSVMAILNILNFTNEVAGYKWRGNDDSVIFFYDDYTFKWYKEDGSYDDNYYEGYYEIYTGEAAIEYVANDLAAYGVTEVEQRQLISNKNIENAMDNYYVIVLDNEYLTFNGVKKDFTSDTYYLGFYLESEEYLDLVNMKTANYAGFTRVYEIE